MKIYPIICLKKLMNYFDIWYIYISYIAYSITLYGVVGSFGRQTFRSDCLFGYCCWFARSSFMIRLFGYNCINIFLALVESPELPFLRIHAWHCRRKIPKATLIWSNSISTLEEVESNQNRTQTGGSQQDCPTDCFSVMPESRHYGPEMILWQSMSD